MASADKVPMLAEGHRKIDDEVRHMVINGATTIQLRNRARELGMRTLREDGVRKVLAGLTTAEEVITTTMTDVN